METIYKKIAKAVKDANINGIEYKEGYPTDMVELDNSLIEDEESDTMTPLVKAMGVIMETIKKEADNTDDIRVCFCHLPGDENWGISIGDGR